jgi:antitoxin PrlF
MRATLTSKGQVTLPAPIRAALRLRTGSRVDFVQRDGLVILVPDDAQARLRAFVGYLGSAGSTDALLDESRGPAEIP